MNLNDYVLNRAKGRGKKSARGLSAKDVLGSKRLMGPPLKPPPTKRSSTTTSSELNWGKSHVSIPQTTPSARKSVSSSSSEHESRIIIAITEGRGEARGEVGMAAINVSRPHLILCQISDTQSYVNTLTKINIFNPSEIIMPQTFLDNLSSENRLIDIIKKQFPNVKYTTVARSIFNKTSGIEVLKQLCIESSSPILLALQHKYYALSAASAVLTYAQENLFVYYSHGSIKVEYEESEGYAIIDVSTADRLELVCSTRPAQANKYSSLFGVLNNCLTKIGSRNLRSMILQPLCSVEKLEERLECVSEIYLHPQALISIQAILQKIPNVDILLTLATLIPTDPQRCSNRHINYVLLLNSVLDLIAPLKEVMSTLNQPFYKSFLELLEGDEFALMKDSLRKVIHEDAYPAKGPMGHLQKIFAIKVEVNGLLDLVRKTYSERIEDMRDYVKRLGDKYNLPFTLGNNNTKGYHIVLALNQQQKKFMKKSDLPEEFIEVYRLAGSFTMKTPELVNLSTRIDDIMEDIFKISNLMIQSMIVKIKDHMGLFYKLCENIAYLDVLQALAETSRQNNYVRPKFGDYTELIGCYHPILDHLCSTKVTSNSITSSNEFNIHIVTGPNGSGKSVYIRQVALVQILAQIGCFVPATSAVVRPANRIYARVYLEDDMESDASTFVLEMKELQYIMTTMTDKSLIIIDEPCRSTSLEEGTALSLAVCEKFARTSSFLYITTHFTLTTKLYDMYLNVKIWQMETLVTGDDTKNTKLDYKYNILPGATKVTMYGVHLVRNLWPEGVLKHVYDFLKMFEKPRDPKIVVQDERFRLKYNLEYKFRKLKSENRLTVTEINKCLEEYQEKLKNLGSSLNNIVLNVGNFNVPRTYSEIEERSKALETPPNNFIENSIQSQDMIRNEHSNIYLDDIGATSHQTYEEIDRRMHQIFTPELSQDNANYFSDTSSCRINKSEFLNDSRNLEKMVPETILHCTENTSSDDYSGNAFGLFGLNDSFTKSEASIQMSQIIRRRLAEGTRTSLDSYHYQQSNIFFENQILSGSDVSKQMSDIVKQKLSEDMLERNRQNYLAVDQARPNLFPQAQSLPTQESSSTSRDFNFEFQKPLQYDRVRAPTSLLGSFGSECSESDVSQQLSEIVRQKVSEGMLERNRQNYLAVDQARPNLFPQVQSQSTQECPSASRAFNFEFQKPLQCDQSRTSIPLLRSFDSECSGSDVSNQMSEIVRQKVSEDMLERNSQNYVATDQNLFHQIQSPTTQESTKCSSNSRQSSSLDLPRNFSFEFQKLLQTDRIRTSTPLELRFDSECSSSQKIVTPIILNNVGDVDVEAIKDEIAECSRLLEEDENFEEEVTMTGKKHVEEGKDEIIQICSPEKEYTRKSQYAHYISPKVNVIEGLNNTSVSFDAEDNTAIIECNNEESIRESQRSPNISSKDLITEEANTKLSSLNEENNDLDNQPSLNQAVEEKASQDSIHDNKTPNNTNTETESSISYSPVLPNPQPDRDSEAIPNKVVEIHTTSHDEPKSDTLKDHSNSNQHANENINIDSNEENEVKSSNCETSPKCVENVQRSNLENKDTSNSMNISFQSCKSHSSDLENAKPELTTTSGVSSASRKRRLDTGTSSSRSETNLSSISKKRNIDGASSTSLEQDADAEVRPKTSDSSNSNKESCVAEPVMKKRLGYSKRPLKPKKKDKQILPHKSMKVHEIKAEFWEQDRKLLLDSSNESSLSKYLGMIKNRPTAQQVKATKHLATIKRTSEGIQVIPAKNAKRKKKDFQSLRSLVEKKVDVDVTIFSDKNAKPFEEFIKSDEKDYKTFHFNFTKNQERTRGDGMMDLFQATAPVEKPYDGIRTFQTSLFRTKSTDIFRSQDVTLTPDGFYKQNKREIEEIMNKFRSIPERSPRWFRSFSEK